jgi:hypothetical protein
MKICMQCIYGVTVTLLLVLVALPTRSAAATSPTTTTLSVTAAGNPAALVTAGNVVTLMAKVKSKNATVTVGQVNFCDAAAKYCTDIYVVGTAQLTSAGAAAIKFVPGIGKHSYRAVFVGTPNGITDYGSSVSRDVALSVTGKFPTSSSIAVSGGVGDYTLTATVAGLVNSSSVPAPVGKVSFLDTTEDDHVLGRAALGGATVGLSFLNSSNPATSNQPVSVEAVDLNGDGELDLVVTTGCCAISILLGNGDGTFTAAPPVALPGLNTANNAAVGDFNSDGKPDLALSLPNDGEVLVLAWQRRRHFHTHASDTG